MTSENDITTSCQCDTITKPFAERGISELMRNKNVEEVEAFSGEQTKFKKKINKNDL